MIYTYSHSLSLHYALPILVVRSPGACRRAVLLSGGVEGKSGASTSSARTGLGKRMTRLDGHDRIEGDLRGGVIALGNFDGFHAGHQAVVGRAVHHAKDEGLPAIVATFDPHPVRFFKPDVPRSESHTSELQS